MDRLDILWAESRIEKLAMKYALAVDTRDWPLMNSLWVQDKEPETGQTMLDYHIARQFGPLFDGCGSSQMFIANHLIEVQDERHATGTVYCHCTLDWDVFNEQRLVYRDNYVCRDGEWLFYNRDHLLWWGREWADNPMRLPPADWPHSRVGSGVAFDEIRVDNRS